MKYKIITKAAACTVSAVLVFLAIGTNAFSIVNFSAGENGLIDNDTTPYTVSIISGDETIAAVPIGIGLRGDADKNGMVEILDAIKIAQYLMGKTEDNYEQTIGFAMADTNLDGKTDILDAVNIAKYLLTSGTHEERWNKILKK